MHRGSPDLGKLKMPDTFSTCTDQAPKKLWKHTSSLINMGGGMSILPSPFMADRLWGPSAPLLCWHTMANSYLAWLHVHPDVSSRSGLAAVSPFISRRRFPPVCLRKSQPVEQWENPGPTKDLEAPPPFFFLNGGFTFLLRQTLETAVFPAPRCVVAYQVRSWE